MTPQLALVRTLDNEGKDPVNIYMSNPYPTQERGVPEHSIDVRITGVYPHPVERTQTATDIMHAMHLAMSYITISVEQSEDYPSLRLNGDTQLGLLDISDRTPDTLTFSATYNI